jgi:octanoyl-[GcvH]:protein N-octanoyltransferase
MPQLVTHAFADRPAFDTAVSRAILERVARGELPDTVRLARPGPMVAFGKQDVSSPWFTEAVGAARAGGFDAVKRLAGGRAAVFHDRTVAFAWARATHDPWPGTHDRFREVSAVLERALQALGVDARVGEIPGEYCPGEYSVNARGRTKLVGIGQRIIRGASHIGGVIVVGGADRVRDVLVPVYDALGLDWDPATSGSVEDEIGAVAFEDVATAIRRELGPLEEATLDPETLALAERLAPEHEATPAPGPT